MAMEHGQISSGGLENLCAKIHQSQKKESHVCEYADCKKGKKGYSKYCREHKAIGKITAGRIARQKRLKRLLQGINPTMSAEVANPIINDEIHLDSKDQIGLLLSGVVLIFSTHYSWRYHSLFPMHQNPRHLHFVFLFGLVSA